MIITAYDGRNLATVTDALQLKIIVNALEMLTLEDYAVLKTYLEEEGFQFSLDDIISMVQQFRVILRPTVGSIKPFTAKPTQEEEDDDKGPNYRPPKRNLIN